ncbi:protein Shroom4-like [Megalops cyprinoides]|uniref:protein Shroom4-like n=1 Tax=Megalops cyprinoides TaxID=118141 RepID=UPI00186499FD|nr:protein Shroom4-like [Megalops cyprinoides]
MESPSHQSQGSFSSLSPVPSGVFPSRTDSPCSCGSGLSACRPLPRTEGFSSTDDLCSVAPESESNRLSWQHRHSAPEQLLSAQLQLLAVSRSPPPQGATTPPHPADEPEMAEGVCEGGWSERRSSTPGLLEESWREPAPSPPQHLRGRSVSVPGAVWEGPLCPAPGGADTLQNPPQEEGVGDGSEPPNLQPKPGPSRRQRLLKSRRRNERFATNLRNEIQQKKAQLLRAASPLLQEQEAGEPLQGAPAGEEDSLQSASQPGHAHGSRTSPFSTQAPPTRFHAHTAPSPHPSAPPGQTLTVVPLCSRGEQAVLTGKPHRWRWTPEHKLQPEFEPKGRSYGAGTASSMSRPAPRHEKSDLPPFAARMRFFEETSRSLSVSNLPGLTSQCQRLSHPPVELDPPAQTPRPSQRRYSYQGCGEQDPRLYCPPEAWRPTGSSNPEHCGSRGELRAGEGVPNPSLPADGKGRMALRDLYSPCNPHRHRSAFHPVTPPGQQGGAQQQPGHSHGSETHAEVSKTADSVRAHTHTHTHTHTLCIIPPPAVHSCVTLPFKQVPAPGRDVEHGHIHVSIICSQHCSSRDASQTLECENTWNILHVLVFVLAFFQMSNISYLINLYLAIHTGIPLSSPAIFGIALCVSVLNNSLLQVHYGRQMEKTEFTRNFSLRERDQLCCSGDFLPAEGAVPPDHESQLGDSVVCERLSERCVEEEAAHWPGQRPSLSESGVPTGLQRLRRSAAQFQAAVSSTQESSNTARKKRPPPPRPPPPKWEQFHRRRASYNSLLSSTPSPTPETPNRASPSHPPDHLQVTRQRSYSLPLREGVPPSPALSHRVFRPVTPPGEREMSLQHAGLSHAHASPEPCTRLAVSRTAPDEGRPHILKPRAEWQRGPVCDGQGSLGVPGIANGSARERPSPQSYFTITCEQQEEEELQDQVSNKGPEQWSAAREEEDRPFETDIDLYQDRKTDSSPRVETQCSARMGKVLETDLDSFPEAQAPPPAVWMAHHCPLLDVDLEGDAGCNTRADLMEELFPHRAEEEEDGRETWRGRQSLLELSRDTLQRDSRWGFSATQGPGFTCSKALLPSCVRDLPGRHGEDEDDELSYKKQLMESLRRKLAVLREAQRGLQEDIRANARLGEEVEALVLAICKPSEVDKFRMFIGDLDKVVSLLLSLSGRLLRVENALDSLDGDGAHHQRLPLLEKKQQLLGQLKEAQSLKEHVDGRQQAVSRVLSRCLTPDQLRDYNHYVKMKAALLVEQRQLEDKIRLGEEQLRALRESLGLGNGVLAGIGYY